MLSISNQRKADFVQRKADFVFKMLTRQSKKSKSPHMIDLKNILNGEIKFTEDNPKFRLSIEDYSKMCNDESIKEIIARVLNTDIISLSAFCEDVQVLNNYIDLSHSTVKEKKIAKALPIKTLLTHLPADTIKKITDHYQNLFKYKLVEWIKVSKILHLWTFKMPILVFIILVFSYLIFLNIIFLSIICSI